MKALITLMVVCLPLKDLKLTSPFGYRLHPLTGKINYHPGIDLRAKEDTVYSVLNGIVRSVYNDRFLGETIVLQHGEIHTIYGHLYRSMVKIGETVPAGQPIALSGATGRVTAAHLHFSIRYRQRYIDPLTFLHQLLKITNHEQKL